MSQDVSSTILYICAVYKQKYAVRIRNAKKVRHCLRAAARCTGGHMPGAPLPVLPRQGKERQAVRATSPRQPRSSAAALCSQHGQSARREATRSARRRPRRRRWVAPPRAGGPAPGRCSSASSRGSRSNGRKRYACRRGYRLRISVAADEASPSDCRSASAGLPGVR